MQAAEKQDDVTDILRRCIDERQLLRQRRPIQPRSRRKGMHSSLKVNK